MLEKSKFKSGQPGGKTKKNQEMDKQPLIELQDLSQTATNISSKITYTLTSNSTNNQGQYIFQPINSSDNYHFGNLKTFFFDKNNIPQIVIGPDYQ